MEGIIEEIINYLEEAYARAKSVCDYENMVRLARAINAFKAPLEMNIFTMSSQNKIGEADLIEETLDRR